MQQGLLETIYRNYETAHPVPWTRGGSGHPHAHSLLASKHLTNFDTRSPVAAEQRDDCAQKMHFHLQTAGIVQRI